MKRKRGVSAIELVIIVGVLLLSVALYWLQKQDIDIANRDSTRKTAINTLYAHLEKSYYPAKKSYPSNISQDTLPGVDKKYFSDPENHPIGSGNSTLRYESTGCNGDSCQGYTLRALLEKEADFIKQSSR